MITPNQEAYLKTIPENKVAFIKPFDPEVQEVARKVIKKVKNVLPNLKVLFMGASALGIAGQNDIDLNILSVPSEYNQHLPKLKKLYGEPTQQNKKLIKWEFIEDGFDIELYLTDKNSSSLQEQIKTFELLRDNSEMRQEYEKIKLKSNGLSFIEYMRRKYEFFNSLPLE